MGSIFDSSRQANSDRRANSRYDLELEFDLFHLHGAKHLVWAGSGQTLNWSRNSILIRPDRPLPASGAVQLVVRWAPGVQLIVVGRLLSSQQRGAVVKILKRRFRGKPQFYGLPRESSASQPDFGGARRARAC